MLYRPCLPTDVKLDPTGGDRAAGGPVPSSPDQACPHCGSLDLSTLAGGRTWTYAGEQCGLRGCGACGGQFSHPLPSPRLLERLYGQDFEYGWYRDHYPAKLIDAVARVFQYRRLGVLPGRRLLDFGGGLGYFARAARLFGYQAVTLDPMLDAAGAARQPLADGGFDVAVLHHVLEHAPRPREVLDRVGGLLAPSGTLVLAVPNAASLGYRQRGVDFVWSQPPFVHIHHFTARGLRSLLAAAGFEVLAEHYFERWDASTLADVRLPRLFARFDGRWKASRWPYLAAQVASAARFAALCATPVVSSVQPSERPELLIVARPGGRRPASARGWAS